MFYRKVEAGLPDAAVERQHVAVSEDHGPNGVESDSSLDET